MRFSSRVPFGLAPNAWAARLEALRATGAELIDLTDANPTRTGLSGPAAGRAGAAAGTCYEPDPLGAPAARAAVADYYAGRGCTVDASAIVLTASTSEAYAHAFRLLADPGEAILVPSPSYPLFVPLARAEGVTVLSYRLAWDGGWHIDFDDLERAIGPRARAIVVVAPNHPTGSCLAPPERERLEALAARRGLAIIADEVFGDFPWPGEFRGAGAGFEAALSPARAGGLRVGRRVASPTIPGPSLPSLADATATLTLVMSGLSKVCGLPQMKAGWIVVAGPPAARAAALERLAWLSDLFLSVSTPAQLALPQWLAGRHAFHSAVHERLGINLARLARARERAPELTPLPADGGWVAIVGLPRRYDEERWILALLDRGVIVHPGHFYDLDPACVVVSLIVEPERFDRGLARLEALVAES